MTVEYQITEDLRIKLKEPFGVLFQGSFDETISKVKEFIEKEKPPRIISVGDVVADNLHAHNINPQLTIIDNKSLRNLPMPQRFKAEKTVCVVNPQGTITKEAIVAVKEAIAINEHTHIVVDGEEDLLTLIAVLYAPEDAIVVYGQPYRGLVVVKVTAQKKAQIRDFLKVMEPSKS